MSISIILGYISWICLIFKAFPCLSKRILVSTIEEYKLKNEESRDVYSIILKAISEDPPIISIPLDDIKNRVDKLLKDKLEKNKIRESLAKLQDIIVDSEPIYQVFEWKDNKVYILDPLFLFYLRWGKHSIRTYKK